MKIIGAGMAGLLAGNMLSRYRPEICEAQDSLPNNHHALLRFRSDAVGRACGIKFRPVDVTKMVAEDGRGYNEHTATLYQANRYALKVTGKLTRRSAQNLAPSTRYIAPPDLIETMAIGLDIKYDQLVSGSFIMGRKHFAVPDTSPIISTMPMLSMMEMVGWPDIPAFDYRPIWTISAIIAHPAIDVYQTVYFPGKQMWYRASLAGSRLTVECIMEPGAHRERDPEQIVFDVLSVFGMDEFTLADKPVVNYQKYGKLVELDGESNSIRREFILYLTDEYNVYSLGRFATWRQILLDDVVHDVERIDEMITTRDQYDRRLRNES